VSASRSFGIAGQLPSLQWRENPEGQRRTIQEAIEIARKHGVVIPDDVGLYMIGVKHFAPDTYALGPRVDKEAGEKVLWSDLVHDRTGKVPFRFRRDIFTSDEAIVAVIAHEVYELSELRPLLLAGELSIEDYIAQTEPGRPGNLHDQAWDVAGELVRRMRGA
jgi:hypothetical protein